MIPTMLYLFTRRLHSNFGTELQLRRLRFFGQWDKLRADRSKEA
jgi:hypothetical protein